LAEKAQLQRICSRKGKGEHNTCVEESCTCAELLQKFPSARPSVGQLLDCISDIKPRLYSIASSSRLRGENACNPTIIKNEWTATSGRNRVGLSTHWLSEVEPGQDGLACHGTVHPSAVTDPPRHGYHRCENPSSTPSVIVETTAKSMRRSTLRRCRSTAGTTPRRGEPVLACLLVATPIVYVYRVAVSDVCVHCGWPAVGLL